MNLNCFWLTERQFARLEPLLPTDTPGKPRVDDRRVISGIVHVLKSGGRWIDAPDVYGPRKTLYNRFVRWAAKGVWADIFHALASAGGPPEQVLIDSSAVKAHRCSSGGKGGSKIKPSAVIDAAERRAPDPAGDREHLFGCWTLRPTTQPGYGFLIHPMRKPDAYREIVDAPDRRSSSFEAPGPDRARHRGDVGREQWRHARLCAARTPFEAISRGAHSLALGFLPVTESLALAPEKRERTDDGP